MHFIKTGEVESIVEDAVTIIEEIGKKQLELHSPFVKHMQFRCECQLIDGDTYNCSTLEFDLRDIEGNYKHQSIKLTDESEDSYGALYSREELFYEIGSCVQNFIINFYINSPKFHDYLKRRGFVRGDEI